MQYSSDFKKYETKQKLRKINKQMGKYNSDYSFLKFKMQMKIQHM